MAIICFDSTISRNGAKTLLRDAKAGVDAVGQGWQNKRDDDGQTFERKWTESRGLVQPESDREYEVSHCSKQ